MIRQRLRRFLWVALLIPALGLSLWAALATTTQKTLAQTVPPPSNYPIIQLVDVITSGLTLPVHLTHAGDGSQRMFIAEKKGVIRLYQNGALQATPFLDIHERVNSTCDECGLLSIAFPTGFASKKYFFVYYNAKGNPIAGPANEPDPADGNDSVIARFRLAANGQQADPNSEEKILLVNQPYRNHNGGQLAFGPDRFLYVGLGDGGSANDPLNAGQRLDTLLGKILRIEVGDSGTYSIPVSNPFTTTTNAKKEIWSYGWRNPWRFSFDPVTGDMFIGDVGQGSYEEVDHEPAGQGGRNYGWKIKEGRHCFQASGCNSAGLIDPFFEYGREDGISVTGGHVYRGPAYPRMVGLYFFADFGSGRIWAAQPEANAFLVSEVFDTNFNISSFGEDEKGELYVVDYVDGAIHRLTDLGNLESVVPRNFLPLLRK